MKATERPAGIDAIVRLLSLRANERTDAWIKLRVATPTKGARWHRGPHGLFTRRSSHMRALLGLAAFAAMILVSPLQAQSLATGSLAVSSGESAVSTWSRFG